MKNILIYLGTHNGRGELSTQLKENQHDLYYAFECNSMLFKELKQLQPYYPKLRLVLKAAWVHNDTMTLNIGSSKQYGSSFFKKKHLREPSANRESTATVECIDFSSWLSENFTNELIDLHLDIEGAEYEVLNKMIKDGSIDLIKSIVVEWHTSKVKNVDYWQSKKDILEVLKEKKIDLIEWRR